MAVCLEERSSSQTSDGILLSMQRKTSSSGNLSHDPSSSSAPHENLGMSVIGPSAAQSSRDVSG